MAAAREEGAQPGGAAARRREGAVLVGIFVLALIARALHLLAMWRGPFSPSVYLPIDGRLHHVWAIEWLNGAWPPLLPFERPPLFTLLLGATYAATGPHPVAVLALQGLLGACSCLLVHGIAREVFDDRRVARVAALLCALSGPLVYFDAQLLSATLDVFLGLLLLRLLLLAGRRGDALLWIAAGAAAGLSALNRGAVLLFAPFAVYWAARLAQPTGRARPGGRAGLLAAVLTAGAMLLVVLPATWHNARYDRPGEDTSVTGGLRRLATGGFVPVATNAGLNFYLGNHLSLRRFNQVDHPEHMAIYDRIRREPEEAGFTSFSAGNRHLLRTTLAHVVRWPGDWIQLMGIKLAELLNGTEIARNTSLYADRADSPVLAALLWRAGLAFPTGLLLPFGIAGIALAWPDRKRHFLVLCALGAQAAFVVAFFVTSRYRLPMLPLLAIYAADAGVTLFDAWRQGRRRRAERLTGLLVLGVALANLPFVELRRTHHWMEHYNLAIALLEHQRPADAERHLRRAVDLEPELPSPLLGLCDLLLGSERPREALALCGRAVEADPESASAHFRLASALEENEQIPAAVRHYRQALRLAPEAADAQGALRRLDTPPGPPESGASGPHSGRRGSSVGP